MKILTSILLPFLLAFAFVAAPTGEAVACESGGGCCKKEAKSEQKSCCSDNGDQSSPCDDGDGCGGDCGHKGCHCPPTCPVAQIANIPVRPALNPPTPTLSGKAAWYFINKIPCAVYLSIWLPPKLVG